ncbi:MAG: hypothetical protein ACRCTA_07520, partial [Bacilli bacterium]
MKNIKAVTSIAVYFILKIFGYPVISSILSFFKIPYNTMILLLIIHLLMMIIIFLINKTELTKQLQSLSNVKTYLLSLKYVAFIMLFNFLFAIVIS